MTQFPPPPQPDDLSGEPQVPPPGAPYGQAPVPHGYQPGPQGYPGQQGYPQDFSGQQGYPAQPGYPQGYQQGPPPGFQPLPVPQAKPRKHWKWIVPVCVVAALALGGVVWSVTRDPHPEDAKTAGRHLSLPGSVAGYDRLTSYDTGQIKDRMAPVAANLGGSGSKLVDSSVVGAYARSASASTPQLLLIAFPVHDVPELQNEVRDNGADAAVGKVMKGAGTPGAYPVSAGRLGGGMSCGMQGTGAIVVGFCAWVDRSYVAMMILQDPGTSDQLSSTFQRVRTAAEH